MDAESLKFSRNYLICEADLSAIHHLAQFAPEVSKQKLKKAMQFGSVWLTRYAATQNDPEHKKSKNGKKSTQRLRRAKKILNVGDELHLYYDEKILFSPPLKAELIADEKDYSIWNKPCGMLSQGTKWGDHTEIARWVELYVFPERPSFIVHRLDRAANGLILLAHSKKVASQLALLFEQRKVKKQYRALVNGNFPSEMIKIENNIDNKNALTRILAINYQQQQSELLIQIETGRKHQIRKHLAQTGYPIVGDRLYNDGPFKASQDLQLTACYLAFECPISQTKKHYQLGA